MKKLIFAAAVFILPVFYYACGGSGDGGGATGTVPLYLTDDMGDFQQVSVTINSVQLMHTGTNTTCDLLTEPESADIANLVGVLQLLDTSECMAHPYNRVRIEFEQAVGLMDQNGQSADCLFASYKEQGNLNQPNILNCTNGTCSITINGGINVIADTVNPFALDFDLKNFEVVNFAAPECRVTLKVEPQNNNDIAGKMGQMYKKSVTGYVSDLDIDVDTFTLITKKGAVFTVDYAQALYRNEPQPDLDGLLQFAADHGLRVRVMARNIDISGETPTTASTLFVKLEGRVGELDDLNHVFTLENAKRNITITVDYSVAKVEGNLTNDIWVETKLFGIDLDSYLAHEVEVEGENVADTDD